MAEQANTTAMVAREDTQRFRESETVPAWTATIIDDLRFQLKSLNPIVNLQTYSLIVPKALGGRVDMSNVAEHTAPLGGVKIDLQNALESLGSSDISDTYRGFIIGSVPLVIDANCEARGEFFRTLHLYHLSFQAAPASGRWRVSFQGISGSPERYRDVSEAASAVEAVWTFQYAGLAESLKAAHSSDDSDG
ncbi:MAG: hypothetical protein AAFY15_13760 [Cyanobacteria bacterium J06648_11]